MVRFGDAHVILSVAGLGRSRLITRDSPVVTVGLRSSVGPIPSCRSPVVVGEAPPEEATSLGGSGVQPTRPFTWWKQPGGSLMRPAPLNPLQPRTFCPIGSPENRLPCPGNKLKRTGRSSNFRFAAAPCPPPGYMRAWRSVRTAGNPIVWPRRPLPSRVAPTPWCAPLPSGRPR